MEERNRRFTEAGKDPWEEDDEGLDGLDSGPIADTEETEEPDPLQEKEKDDDKEQADGPPEEQGMLGLGVDFKPEEYERAMERGQLLTGLQPYYVKRATDQNLLNIEKITIAEMALAGEEIRNWLGNVRESKRRPPISISKRYYEGYGLYPHKRDYAGEGREVTTDLIEGGFNTLGKLQPQGRRRNRLKALEGQPTIKVSSAAIAPSTDPDNRGRDVYYNITLDELENINENAFFDRNFRLPNYKYRTPSPKADLESIQRARREKRQDDAEDVRILGDPEDEPDESETNLLVAGVVEDESEIEDQTLHMARMHRESELNDLLYLTRGDPAPVDPNAEEEPMSTQEDWDTVSSNRDAAARDWRRIRTGEESEVDWAQLEEAEDGDSMSEEEILAQFDQIPGYEARYRRPPKDVKKDGDSTGASAEPKASWARKSIYETSQVFQPEDRNTLSDEVDEDLLGRAHEEVYQLEQAESRMDDIFGAGQFTAFDEEDMDEEDGDPFGYASNERDDMIKPRKHFRLPPFDSDEHAKLQRAMLSKPDAVEGEMLIDEGGKYAAIPGTNPVVEPPPVPEKIEAHTGPRRTYEPPNFMPNRGDEFEYEAYYDQDQTVTLGEMIRVHTIGLPDTEGDRLRLREISEQEGAENAQDQLDEQLAAELGDSADASTYVMTEMAKDLFGEGVTKWHVSANINKIMTECLDPQDPVKVLPRKARREYRRKMLTYDVPFEKIPESLWPHTMGKFIFRPDRDPQPYFFGPNAVGDEEITDNFFSIYDTTARDSTTGLTPYERFLRANLMHHGIMPVAPEFIRKKLQNSFKKIWESREFPVSVTTKRTHDMLYSTATEDLLLQKERKAVLRARMKYFRLPAVAMERFEAIVGPRYKKGLLTLPVDSEKRVNQNIYAAKKLLQTILAESLKAHEQWVPIEGPPRQPNFKLSVKKLTRTAVKSPEMLMFHLPPRVYPIPTKSRSSKVIPQSDSGIVIEFNDD